MNKKLITIITGTTLILSMFTGFTKTTSTTVKKAATNKISLPYKGEPVVYKGFAADLGIKENSASPVMKEYNKRVGNVNIKWETAPFSDFDQKVQLALNSGDMPDIMWLRASSTIANYGDSGLFLDWNKYKAYMPNWQRYLAKYPNLSNLTTNKGEIFAITDIEPLDCPQESWFYNNTLLKKYKLTPPKTLDEMVTTMEKLKKLDPTIIPFQSYWNFDYVLQAFGDAMGVKQGFFFNEKTRKWEYAPLSSASGYKELIGTVAKMYKEKLINPEVATMSWEQELQTIASNKWAFTYVYNCSPELEIYKTHKLPIEIKAMNPPSYKGVSRLAITTPFDTTPGWGFFASAKVKNPELLAAYVDNIISKETGALFDWGVEGVTYTQTKGVKKFIPAIVNGTKKPSDFGIGKIMDPRYIHLKDRNAELALSGPLERATYKTIVNNFNSGRVKPIVERSKPLISVKDNEELGKIMTPIKTYMDENQLKFLTGKRPMTEWNDFTSKIKTMGDINRAVEIYNKSKQIKRVTKRNYVEIK